MPPDHQKFLERNGSRFRKWADKIGPNTYKAIDAILTSSRVEEQTYKGCMVLLKLAERHSQELLDASYEKVASCTSGPIYLSIKNILVTGTNDKPSQHLSR